MAAISLKFLLIDAIRVGAEATWIRKAMRDNNKKEDSLRSDWTNLTDINWINATGNESRKMDMKQYSLANIIKTSNFRHPFN